MVFAKKIMSKEHFEKVRGSFKLKKEAKKDIKEAEDEDILVLEIGESFPHKVEKLYVVNDKETFVEAVKRNMEEVNK